MHICYNPKRYCIWIWLLLQAVFKSKIFNTYYLICIDLAGDLNGYKENGQHYQQRLFHKHIFSVLMHENFLLSVTQGLSP